jgi:hypothetical protein
MVTIGPGDPAPGIPPRDASQQLTAVATGLAGRDIMVRLTSIGDTPVLTAQGSVPRHEPATVSVDPDTTQPGLPLECTCIWTTPTGTTPATIADTIVAVLNAVRPPSAHDDPPPESAPTAAG